MLVRLMSDLHLEFGDLVVPPLPEDEGSTLVLCGDVGVKTSHSGFILAACDRFKHVIYILGNHEHYGATYQDLIAEWRNIATKKQNLYFLENDTAVVDGVRFIGATTWTDLNHGDPKAIYEANRNMSCFSAIKYRENDKVINFRAHHSTEEHKKSAQFIADETNKHFDGKTVVLTHHLPLSSCVSAEFVGSSLNPAFHANLDKLFENKIDYWFYGHTHTAQHQVVNGTVVQCNPRGYYGHESVAKTGFQVNLQINL